MLDHVSDGWCSTVHHQDREDVAGTKVAPVSVLASERMFTMSQLVPRKAVADTSVCTNVRAKHERAA